MYIQQRLRRGAIDLDGVVAETYRQLVRECRERYAVKTKVGHAFSNYDLTQNSDITRPMMTEVFGAADFYRDLPFMPHAKAALAKLKATGYSLHVITARPATRFVVADTLHWLASNRVPLDSVHLVSHSSASGGTDEKMLIARGLELGWAVEDSPANARAYAKVCEVVFLQDTSYNANEKMPRNVVRVNNLRGVEHHLRQVSNMTRGQRRDYWLDYAG